MLRDSLIKHQHDGQAEYGWLFRYRPLVGVAQSFLAAQDAVDQIRIRQDAGEG